MLIIYIQCMELALVTNLVSSQYKADQLFQRRQHTIDLRQSQADCWIERICPKHIRPRYFIRRSRQTHRSKLISSLPFFSCHVGAQAMWKPNGLLRQNVCGIPGGIWSQWWGSIESWQNDRKHFSRRGLDRPGQASPADQCRILLTDDHHDRLRWEEV